MDKMYGLSMITEELLAKAHRNAERMLCESNDEVERIKKLYEKEAQLRTEKVMAAADREAEEIRQSSRSQAGIEGRNLKLSARHKVLDRVFHMAEEQLSGLDKPSKKALYEDIINAYCSSGQVEIRLNKADAAQLASSLKVNGMDIIIDKRAGRFSGGMMLNEGDVEMDCTFRAMTQRAREEMESEIADELFS